MKKTIKKMIQYSSEHLLLNSHSVKIYKFKMFGKILFSLTNIVALIVMFSLQLGFNPLDALQQAYAYNTSEHKWIIKKAVEYIEEKGDLIASKYPLDEYLKWLYYGVEYADNTGVNCIWDYGFGEENHACDSIHHFGFIDDIKMDDLGFPVTVAHPGGFAAPFYAEELFKQAINFWPGGPEPSLYDLPKRDGGYVTTFFDSSLLYNTWVGGLPFCEAWVAEQLGSNIIPLDACPKWPQWASNDDATIPVAERYKTHEESIKNAMKYLGWAIHMVEDLTVPVHARNISGKEHRKEENQIHQYIEGEIIHQYNIEGEIIREVTISFNHLPVRSDGNYTYKPCGPFPPSSGKCNFWFPVSSDYFDRIETWTVEQYANETRRITIEAEDGSAILPSHEDFCDRYILWGASYYEKCVDTAIKLVAAIIEKYFSEIPLSPDSFEQNDNFSEATKINAGNYSDLSLHVPFDEDWYMIHIDKDYSDLVIDITYDKTFVEITARVASELSSYAGVPEETDNGMKIIMNSVQAGDYWLHLYPLDYQIAKYDMTVLVETGSLPPDRYEDNDTPETATEFFIGCDSQNELNIDKAGDNDYYYITANQGERITAEIEFDPTQGELQLFLYSIEATNVLSESMNSKQLSISLCVNSAKPMVRVTGNRNHYNMCIDKNTDPDCGFEPPQKNDTDFCFESEVSIDNVHILSFSDNGTGMDIFLPPDSDGDLGGNISNGKSCLALTPTLGTEDMKHYVLIGTTEDEKCLVVSASKVDLTGVNFDTEFSVYLYYTEIGIIRDLSDGTFDSVDVLVAFYSAGYPEGLLLTPFGKSAYLYTFPGGKQIGWVKDNDFGDSGDEITENSQEDDALNETDNEENNDYSGIIDKNEKKLPSIPIYSPIFPSLTQYQQLWRLSFLPIYLEQQKQNWYNYQLNLYQQVLIQTLYSGGEFWPFFAQPYWYQPYFPYWSITNY